MLLLPNAAFVSVSLTAVTAANICNTVVGGAADDRTQDISVSNGTQWRQICARKLCGKSRVQNVGDRMQQMRVAIVISDKAQ